LASGLTGKVRRVGLGFREVGNADFDGDDGQHTTATDRFEVKGVDREPKSSHVKSVLMRHIQTGNVPYYSRGFYKRWKWGKPKSASSHRLRRDEHLYDTGIAKTAWSSGQTSIHHDPRPQRPPNSSCELESKDNVHGSVYGALITGSRIGGASCAHAGLRLSYGIALVPVQAS
jgi:hypothetical protein